MRILEMDKGWDEYSFENKIYIYIYIYLPNTKHYTVENNETISKV